MGSRMRLSDDEVELVRQHREATGQSGTVSISKKELDDILNKSKPESEPTVDTDEPFQKARRPQIDGRNIESDEPFLEGYSEHAEPLVIQPIYGKVGAMYDVHVPIHDVDKCNYVMKWLRDKIGINGLILGGDFADLHNLSSHGKDSRFYDLAYELSEVQRALQGVRRFFGDSFPIWYLRGNHEERFERRIRMAREKLANLDSHIMLGDTSSYSDVLNLRELGIVYADSGMGITMGNMNWLHGHEIAGAGKNPARLKLSRAKRNIAFGHHHTYDVAIDMDMFGVPVGAWAVPCLSQRTPEYRRYSFWKQGCAFAEFDKSGDFRFENRLFVRGELH